MDIARYIGLFLLKNEQCYVNGLGTLQLVRKPASYDGQNLYAASHEINIVPGGNVDESLANFIATNEQTSITKASNALKEYSSDTKSRLQAGEMVTLPFLGKFTAEDGRIGFITDAHLQFKAAPIAARRGLSMQDQPKQDRPAIPHQPYVPSTPANTQMPVGEVPSPQAQQYTGPGEERERLNWARIFFVILLLIICAGAAYYGYMRYIVPQQNVPSRPPQPQLTLPAEVEETLQPPAEDNTQTAADSAMEHNEESPKATTSKEETTPVVNNKEKQKPTEPATPPAEKPVEKKEVAKTNTAGKKLNLKIVVNTFDSKQTAYGRKRELASKGVNADVIEEDVNYYFVVIPVQVSPSDTSRLIDSMSNKFNKDGVFVY